MATAVEHTHDPRMTQWLKNLIQSRWMDSGFTQLDITSQATLLSSRDNCLKAFTTLSTHPGLCQPHVEETTAEKSCMFEPQPQPSPSALWTAEANHTCSAMHDP